MNLILNKKINLVNFLNIIIANFLVIYVFFFNADNLKNYLDYIIFLIIFLILINSLIVLRKISITKLEILWIISLGGLLVSCVNSVYKTTSLKYITMYIFALFIFFYIKNNFKVMSLIIKLFKFYSIIFAILTILPLISEVFYYKIINIFFNYFSYIRIQGFILGGRYPGLAGHMGANGFLLTLGMGVYLGGFLIDKEKQKIKNIVFLFFISISILLTGSRAMILINGFAFIICFYLKSKNSFIEIFKKGVLLIGIIVLFISIVYMIYPQNIINIFDRFSNGDASIYSRFVLYSFAIELFLSRILFGYGINTFLPLTYTNVNMGEKTYVHNVILQLLAETGIIGSIVILIPYLVTFIYTIKVFKKSYIDYKKNILMSLYIQIVFLLYFFTGNPIYDYNILVSYFIIISIPIYYGYKTKNYALSKILK